VEEQMAEQAVQKLLLSWIGIFIYDHQSVNPENKLLPPKGDSVKRQES